MAAWDEAERTFVYVVDAKFCFVVINSWVDFLKLYMYYCQDNGFFRNVREKKNEVEVDQAVMLTKEVGNIICCWVNSAIL